MEIDGKSRVYLSGQEVYPEYRYDSKNRASKETRDAINGRVDFSCMSLTTTNEDEVVSTGDWSRYRSKERILVFEYDGNGKIIGKRESIDVTDIRFKDAEQYARLTQTLEQRSGRAGLTITIS